MIIRCNVCNVIVADVKPGSQIRKGSVMLCKNCLARYNEIVNIGNKAKNDMPDFLKKVFQE